MTEKSYVLGTGLDELQRLGLQHRLWADTVHAAWMRAGLRPGERVLDLGCGPGHASFDLAQWVTSSGRVVGLDASTDFIHALNSQAAARGLKHLEGCVGDAMDFASHPVAKGPFDVVWSRWVMCFLPQPSRAVECLASALAPGGRVVLHDYFNYTSMTMAPRRKSHDRVVEATAKSWRNAGGNPDVGADLPRLLTQAGLKVTHIAMHQRVARGSDPMFAWPDTWWRTYAPKLVAMGLLEEHECQTLFRDLDEIRNSPTDFIVPPPVTEIHAVKL